MYMLFSKLHTSSSASSPGRSGARAKKRRERSRSLFTSALGDSCITFIKELQILLKLQLSLYKQFRSSFKSVYGFTGKSLVQLLIKILQIIVSIGIAMSSVTDKNRCSAAGSVFGQFQYTKPPEPASLHAKKILS